MHSSPLGVRYVPLYWIGLLGLFLGVFIPSELQWKILVDLWDGLELPAWPTPFVRVSTPPMQIIVMNPDGKKQSHQT